MPYKNKPRPYKKEYEQQKERKEQPLRNARERARRKIDKLGIDRKGKDVDHIKALTKGGTNDRKNLRVVSKNKNRSFKRKRDRSVA
jgi:vacuolar-type H+-ATPase subunit H|tara:strand:+ start:710 stop:967 length:258 start_codon:yes stop_codon:yes gene_type:complete